MEDMGNPFLEHGQDSFVLDTKIVADQAVVEAVMKVEQMGKDQYNKFVEERLQQQNKSLFDPLKRNMLATFSRPPVKEQNKTKLQLKSLRNDCTLFSRLYIACQTRDGDLDEFFKHENQAYPPAISTLGQLRLPTSKSDLLECLPKTGSSDACPEVDVLLLDGAVVVNILLPGIAETFDDYTRLVFNPHIERQLREVLRLDLVWDRYFDDSLKSATRSKRGKGIRRHVVPKGKVPSQWKDFLWINSNKTELFELLSQQVVTITSPKVVIATLGSAAISNRGEEVTALSNCTHEEADSRIFVHAMHATSQGYHKIMVRTVDTDVLVIAVGCWSTLKEHGLQELWMDFGSGTNRKYLPAHEISTLMGPEKAIVLPVFHAFTGCDTVSCFAGKGKKTCWETWKAFPEVTTAFKVMMQCPEQIDSITMGLLERFVVLMYCRTSAAETVNIARKTLFTQKNCNIEAIPPTKDALEQHAKRTVLQAGYIWGQALVVSPHLPSPADWGWKQNEKGIWEPLWKTLPEAMTSCRE
jgi:hypothetical protein